ncbi:tRNA adenosine(34) deaminase TadA [Legionella impletisoli]|uniref:tRNA-specific adenosine deaminase n=1 Tax=Legionella impletisoli TaxID=343510 RepID=A0A917JMM5_9GAMM|nr:tRNA adenosine(34) deaminase TadA [Legionella impletisoli]GGI75695.1 tRNA-specific adenosine deaminase [Legionella impletisoli]
MSGYDDAFWMRQALDLAKHAKTKAEVPVGAILISDTNEVLGRGWNRVLETHDPSAHAEIIALREAGLRVENCRLNGTTLYVTLEPCCMCAGALVQARVKRLVFSCRDIKAGACGSVYNLTNGLALNHRIQVDEGILQVECASLLSNFFKEKRV